MSSFLLGLHQPKSLSLPCVLPLKVTMSVSTYTIGLTSSSENTSILRRRTIFFWTLHTLTLTIFNKLQKLA